MYFFIQEVIYSIYINLFSFHAGDCIKTYSSLIVSSKIVNPFVYLLKRGLRSYIARKTFLNELFAKFKIGRSLVLLS